ncbi:MAG: hypothetical protein ACT4O2_03675 [Beijerinckiaceae bacterium]
MAEQPKGDRELHIVQRPPTSWLDPIDMARTGLKTVLAGLFGSFADKREVLAALYPGDDIVCDGKVCKPAFDYSCENDKGESPKNKEVWFDYISDTGDGWNPTYSIAYLAGEDKLTVAPAKDGDVQEILPRGEFTILGGDQVYPAASQDLYRDRLEGPFNCARARGADSTPVYALPGNHDWYDGLTSFIRLFCQKDRWFGQWRATQTRSYFAIKLPHRWWVWGLDAQLESDLDPAQVSYFKRHAGFLKPRDRVILVAPEPSWIEAGRIGKKSTSEARRIAEERVSRAHSNMLLVVKYILDTGATIPVCIAGDSHHYARYEEQEGKFQLITCGGGGAFLHGTFGLPETLDLRRFAGQQFDLKFDRKKEAPTPGQSEKMCGSVFWKLLWRNPWFAVAVGVIYWIYSWFLQAASEALNTLEWNKPASTLFAYLRADHCISWKPWALPVIDLQNFYSQRTPCSKVFWAWGDIALHDPVVFLFSAVIIFVCMKFAVASKRKGAGWPITAGTAVAGFLHGIAHIALALVLIKFAAFYIPWDLAVFPAVFLIGAIPGSLLFALYLWLAHKTIGAHDQEVLSTQAIEDYKCFARFHVTKDKMTIYPIGLEKVCKRWIVAKTVADAFKPLTKERPWPRWRREYTLKVPPDTKRIFEPDPAGALKPRLMEPPIVFASRLDRFLRAGEDGRAVGRG